MVRSGRAARGPGRAGPASERLLPRGRADQRLARGGEVGAAGKLDDRDVPGEQRLDVGEVLADGDRGALALVMLPPLIVVVEDQRYHVEEAVDEAVRRGRVDQAVVAAVEVGEVVVAPVDVPEQVEVLLTQLAELPPLRRLRGQTGKGAGRPQLEHLPDLEQLQREAGGEPLEHPAGVR